MRRLPSVAYKVGHYMGRSVVVAREVKRTANNGLEIYDIAKSHADIMAEVNKLRAMKAEFKLAPLRTIAQKS